jgi:hypothetical protein
MRDWKKISKDFKLKYTHIARGIRQRLSGNLKVTIKGRINPEGPVENFFNIGTIAKMAVIKKLARSCWKKNPTLKQLLIWTWKRLEKAGLKGLHEIEFKNNSGSAVLTAEYMLKAYGWDRVNDKWEFIRKPIDGQKVKL